MHLFPKQDVCILKYICKTHEIIYKSKFILKCYSSKAMKNIFIVCSKTNYFVLNLPDALYLNIKKKKFDSQREDRK